MNLELIDQEFYKAISQVGAHKKMGITYTHRKVLCHQVRRGKYISLDKKIRLLQRAGWRSDAFQYQRMDLLDFAKFILKTSAASKAHGPEYLLEKFLAQK